MAIRNIFTEKEELLRKISRKIEKIDAKILTLLDDMVETMYHANGVGLAAPQVGMLKQVVVIDIGEGLIELINPVILKQKGKQLETEGCLSVPGVFGIVKRPSYIKVEALNRHGESVIVEGMDFLARALSHEIDHLDGILFIDKVIEYVGEQELEEGGQSQ